ncbi:uncharacterized protein VP01_782g3 [Puccinia sorghi]|uniref:Uncharacterized protein n=1 Tax=Puccinia sorghi TaxID=27349 RepID=A0A0L6UBX7_9BASI|nr:uncharacterized protein VP01_782g3 [Puccinia sorghi]
MTEFQLLKAMILEINACKDTLHRLKLWIGHEAIHWVVWYECFHPNDLDEDDEGDEDEDDVDDDDADEGEHERDSLSAADFTSRFLQSANRKPVNIYEADFDLTDQLRNQQPPLSLPPPEIAAPVSAPTPALPVQPSRLTDSQRRPLTDHSTTNNLSATTRTHSLSPPGASNSPQPLQNSPIPPSTDQLPNDILSHRAQQHHYSTLEKPHNNHNSHHLQKQHSNDRRSFIQQPDQQQQPPANPSASGVDLSGGNGHRPKSRASAHPTPRPNKPQLTAAPTTNRSRMGPSEDSTPTISHHHPRPRRVSDGSINGGVRKDILLQRMAEALQSERAKAIVFQRELQNAEREIDDLANTLDEQRREHHKTIVNLRKDIKLLKKERESLVEALEAAEGVEQEEAERYLALLDPAAQAVMAEEDDASDSKAHRSKTQAPTPQPILDDYDLSNYKSTIRAQMQERSALRAQRINSELLKINPAATADPNAGDSDKGTQDVQPLDSNRQGRPRETSNRVRRKLSKTRPSSRDGVTGIFWRRSGSRTRENTNDEKSSSAPGTIMHRYPNQGRKTSVGGYHGAAEEEGYYDSGPLQRSHDTIGGRGHQGNGKIGKLFRKAAGRRSGLLGSGVEWPCGLQASYLWGRTCSP